MNIPDKLSQEFPLPSLIQEDYFVGWTYAIDYDKALVMTNDHWKAKSHGIPHNCFLLATAFNPSAFNQASETEKEVILLRVIGSAHLPQDDEMVRTKLDAYQQRTDVFLNENQQMDDLTRNQLQFGGLECRILGTFYMHDGNLWLGSDIESFSMAARLSVYRPHGKALEAIVNFIDPIRKASAREKAEQLGISGEIEPFKIGTVRYTSTDRLHRKSEHVKKVPVTIEPSDFLARRTAVLGMTRTGKSNMIKQLVAVVKRVADNGGIKIGQIIYDINGEYANANQQDEGALADIYGTEETIRYRMLETEGFEELRINFYEQLNEGFGIIQNELEEANRVTVDYVRSFVNLTFDRPDEQEKSEFYRWQRKVAAYQTLLFAAGFEPPPAFKVHFAANQSVRERVNENSENNLPDPKYGLSLTQAKEWFLAFREANNEDEMRSSSSNKPWADDSLKNVLDMIAQKRGASSYISGHRILADAKKYHTPSRDTDVSEEIYNHLTNGKIVILDLSVGDARIREKLSERIGRTIFNNSMNYFIQGETPPNIVIYIEEAHNLIGRKMALHETWPRIAKEGAKYQIALVYATQEVTSMHPNILANTENWFITHLNNVREIKELAQFYDFEDFSRSLIRAQDVGFARVKTLSGPFVIPTQIDKFDPAAEIERQRESSGG